MVRIVFTYIVPFLFPMAVYLAWGWYRARYAEAHSGEAPKVERGLWPLFLVLGAVLTLASLAFTALTSGGDAGAIYTPQHIENGRLVPGHMDDKPR